MKLSPKMDHFTILKIFSKNYYQNKVKTQVSYVSHECSNWVGCRIQKGEHRMEYKMEIKTNEVQKSHLERAAADSLMADMKCNQYYD